MPSYPPQGGGFPPADIAASVWAYVTRKITNLDDTRAARIDNLDALISSRAPSGEYDTEMARIDATVSSRASPSDILVDPDTDKIDGSLIDASIASRLSKAWFDQIIGDPTPETIVSILDMLHSGDAVYSDVVMDGSELDLGGFSGAPVLSWAEGYVDLTQMESGDEIVFREYVAIREGEYKVYATHTYSGAQTEEPLVHFTAKIQSYGWKVSAEQTATGAGGYKTLPFYFESKYLV